MKLLSRLDLLGFRLKRSETTCCFPFPLVQTLLMAWDSSPPDIGPTPMVRVRDRPSPDLRIPRTPRLNWSLRPFASHPVLDYPALDYARI